MNDKDNVLWLLNLKLLQLSGNAYPDPYLMAEHSYLSKEVQFLSNTEII